MDSSSSARPWSSRSGDSTCLSPSAIGRRGLLRSAQLFPLLNHTWDVPNGRMQLVPLVVVQVPQDCVVREHQVSGGPVAVVFDGQVVLELHAGKPCESL